MSEHPQVVVTRVRRGEPSESKDFKFTKEMIPSVNGNTFLEEYHSKAWEAYHSSALPNIQMEAWRRTDLKDLHPETFQLPGPKAYLDLPSVPENLLEPLTSDSHGGQIILMADRARIKMDPELAGKGVIFTDLQTAQQQYPHILEKIMGKIVRVDESKFSGMAGAFSKTGILIYIPKNVELTQPLHSLLWGSGVGLAYLSHIMVYLDEGASLTYVHEAASPDETGGQTLHSGIVEILVGPSANLKFVELQSWGEHVWNFSHERIRLERDANLEWIFGAVGSHLTKNFSDLDLAGEGSTGRMSGFYFTDKNQHLDHDTQQNHFAPHTTSDLLFKGALLDESRSVWQGMIYVAPGAVKTDGYQANRNLVLSAKARADSIPGLEILADDVRCTHGATVGKIDPEQVFYLLSRGIPEKEAERLIVEGFFDPIMQRIPFEGVRQRFQRAIHEKMATYSDSKS
ncbi:MAG TPA: Fe-S cluster assembly protein SufD [Anaerolineaceae bacterium]|nr:Fe-S cluster assembly protein SufD [Anaerolineaceae bacterium]